MVEFFCRTPSGAMDGCTEQASTSASRAVRATPQWTVHADWTQSMPTVGPRRSPAEAKEFSLAEMANLGAQAAKKAAGGLFRPGEAVATLFAISGYVNRPSYARAVAPLPPVQPFWPSFAHRTRARRVCSYATTSTRAYRRYGTRSCDSRQQGQLDPRRLAAAAGRGRGRR
eukprot:SAG22_NODE_10634_length_524_cov_0.611765_1_plen_171_part_01